MSFELEKRVLIKKRECRRSKKVSFQNEDVFILKPTLIVKRILLTERERERERGKEREKEIRVMNKNLVAIPLNIFLSRIVVTA